MSNDLIPSDETWSRILKQAAVLVRSGLLPKAVNTPEKAAAIMLKGRELGIPPMEALSKLYVVNGDVTMAAEEMLVMIYRKHPNAYIKFVRSNSTACEIHAARQKGGEVTIFTYTIEDAIRAGLSKKDNWRCYPKQMLRWRTISDMAKTVFPDTLSATSHTPEELGARYVISAQGLIDSVEPEVIEAEGLPVEMYDGTLAQKQTLRLYFVEAGIEDHSVMIEIAKKCEGKPMQRLPSIIAREKNRLDKEGATSQQVLAEDYAAKLSALRDGGITEAQALALGGVEKWGDIAATSKNDLENRTKALKSFKVPSELISRPTPPAVNPAIMMGNN